MLPSKIKILADENIPIKVIESLENNNFDVKRAPKGADDNEIADIANSENRIIITFDRDFGNILLFPPQQYSGIVFIRIRPPLINTVFSALSNLFKLIKPSEFKGKLFVLSAHGFRVYPKD